MPFCLTRSSRRFARHLPGRRKNPLLGPTEPTSVPLGVPWFSGSVVASLLLPTPGQSRRVERLPGLVSGIRCELTQDQLHSRESALIVPRDHRPRPAQDDSDHAGSPVCDFACFRHVSTHLIGNWLPLLRHMNRLVSSGQSPTRAGRTLMFRAEPLCSRRATQRKAADRGRSILAGARRAR